MSQSIIVFTIMLILMVNCQRDTLMVDDPIKDKNLKIDELIKGAEKNYLRSEILDAKEKIQTDR